MSEVDKVKVLFILYMCVNRLGMDLKVGFVCLQAKKGATAIGLTESVGDEGHFLNF